MSDDEAEKGSKGGMKLRFIGFDKYLIFQEALQHCTDLLLVFLEGARVNQDVLQINIPKRTQHDTKHICRGIGQTNWHD